MLLRASVRGRQDSSLASAFGLIVLLVMMSFVLPSSPSLCRISRTGVRVRTSEDEGGREDIVIALVNKRTVSSITVVQDHILYFFI